MLIILVSSNIFRLFYFFIFQITQTLNMFVRMTSEVETNIVSVERIKEYSEADQVRRATLLLQGKTLICVKNSVFPFDIICELRQVNSM